MVSVAQSPVTTVAETPTGTVTFLFTDIPGYSKTWEQQPQVLQAALSRLDALLRAAITARRGYIFKTVGTNYYAAFATPAAGVAAAIRAQHDLIQEPWPAPIGPVKVRMALHTGAPEVREGDYFGPPLNRVARLQAIGHAGQILLSTVTAELVREVLPVEIGLRDLGVHRLKDVMYPERVRQVAVPFLPQDFPPLQVIAATTADLDPGELVFGVVIAAQARAYPLRTLQRLKLINDELGGSPISIIMEPGENRPIVLRRQNLGKTVTLIPDLGESNYLTNQERTMWWDRQGRPMTALRGFQAAQLDRLDGSVEWWSSWKGNHPSSTVYMT